MPSWEFAKYPDDLYPYVGLIEADLFDPEKWKPAYPNRAFSNMRPEDAFWAARIVAQFTDEALAGVVKKAQFRDQRAADYVLSVLIKRRDKVVKTWLNGVNPLVNFRLAGDGTLTFDNAAVDAKASTPPSGYAIAWSRFDNATDTHQPVGAEFTVSSPTARAPAGLEGQPIRRGQRQNSAPGQDGLGRAGAGLFPAGGGRMAYGRLRAEALAIVFSPSMPEICSAYRLYCWIHRVYMPIRSKHPICS